MPPAGAAGRPGASRAFLVTCIALLSGAAAYVVALVWLPSSFVDGHYLPVGIDSFYHARRILDTIANPGAFYEFDPRIHAPEGSWIPWPWAYDRLMAWVAAALQQASGAPDPMSILVYIPPTWAFVNAALLVAIGATLGLRPPWLSLLGAAFAFSPLTQMLHGLGVIDHHYVEYTFVLATALAGLRWLQSPQDGRRAALLGAVLGAAPAFHNGLFALQIPVDLTLFILWMKGQFPPARSVAAFALALMALTLAVVLPSEPFRAGQFSFATLSWFHLYAAALTAGGALYLSGRPWSRLDLAVLSAIGAVALVPIASDMATGSRFLSATLVKLGEMSEALSLRGQFDRGGMREIIGTYSALIVLLPLTAAACVAALLRRATPTPWLFATVFALFGIVLLCFQARLHYYGSLALFLPPLLALQHAVARLPRRRGVMAGTLGALALLAAYQPHFRNLWVPVPLGWDFGQTYAIYERALYPRLRQACAEHAGIVLAHNDDGHYIRFHTDCSVISNNFILTPVQEQKLLESDNLLSLSARAIVEEHPDIDYIFVTRRDDIWHEADADFVAAANAGLRAELLLSPGPYAEGLQPVIQVIVRTGPTRTVVLAKVFRILRPGPGAGRPASRGDKS